MILKYFFDVELISQEEGKHTGVLLLFVCCVFLFFQFATFILLKFAKVITIDNQNNSISFMNLLTRKKETFSFDEVDGYYEAIKKTQYGEHYKVLLVMKDNKVLGKISQYYYCNFSGLCDSIKTIKFLGEIKYSPKENFKMLFGKAIKVNHS